MKRIVSILLLILLLFNWFGYRVLISMIEDKANARLAAELDANKYDESQLVSLKIPIKYISYYSSSTTFERIDGQIEINAIQYEYVKRRIYKDSLEVLCIPNHEAMKLKAAQNEFFRFSNDLAQEKKPGPHPASGKRFSWHSFIILDPFHVERLPFCVLKEASYYSDNTTSRYSPPLEQPPDLS